MKKVKPAAPAPAQPIANSAGDVQDQINEANLDAKKAKDDSKISKKVSGNDKAAKDQANAEE